MACRPVGRGHAPEGEQNGLEALGPRREARKGKLRPKEFGYIS